MRRGRVMNMPVDTAEPVGIADLPTGLEMQRDLERRLAVSIGDRCVFQPGVRLGQDGFGYTKQDGRWVAKPHNFGVVIEDDVHIGANTCIDRGSYRDTRIGTGTRIDNLVHIAHNVRIGRHCIIVAGAELSGSVEVGDGAWIGPNACIREHLKIGAGATVGIGAVVVKDVPAGETWAGNPARRLA